MLPPLSGQGRRPRKGLGWRVRVVFMIYHFEAFIQEHGIPYFGAGWLVDSSCFQSILKRIHSIQGFARGVAQATEEFFQYIDTAVVPLLLLIVDALLTSSPA